MNLLRFFTDPAPGGYQDSTPAVKWLITKCAVFPANAWTAMRIVSPAIIIPAYYLSPVLSLVLFAFFALTDFIDGKVARYRNEPGKTGIWLDPFADKVFVIFCFYWFGLVVKPIISAYLFWLMVVVELGGRVLIGLVWKIRGQELDMRAKWWGKMKYGLQIVLGVLLFFVYLIPQIPAELLDFWLALIVVFAMISVASHIWEIPEPRRSRKMMRF